MAHHLCEVDASASILSPIRSTSATLVPVPKSSLPTKDGLWVPEPLCHELVRAGFGAGGAILLERSEPIPKAARSLSTERPSAWRNCRTLSVRSTLEAPGDIVLVDDVVPAGATLLGSANRRREAYPAATLRGFAAARTLSNPTRFVRTLDPVVGTIHLRESGRTQRDP
jgi:hypothetical protein